MRLFAAVDLDPPARSAAGAAARDLAARLEAVGSRPIRWVAPERLHITVRFLGEVTAGEVEAVRGAFRRPFKTGVFTARGAGLGCFPRCGPPRVVWLGIEEGGAGMAAVRAELDGRLAAAGRRPESGAYRAHLTLGRLTGWSARSRRRVDRALSGGRPETPRWKVDRVALYESRPSRHGARYHVIESAPLCGVPARCAETGGGEA